MEVSAAEICTGTRGKRIRGRFRATLAGLLELEVLRVRHKQMVEAALERPESSDHLNHLITSQQERYQYWVEASSFRLKIKRSLSHENLSHVGNPRRFLDIRRSFEDLHDLQRHRGKDQQSRVSSGFCESHSDAMSSLSVSLASLSHQSTDDSAGHRRELQENFTWRSDLLKNKQEHTRKDDTKTSSGFSQVVIPEAGFISVSDLYPDSHWPDISNILQPQVVLEPSYRSDLRSCQGSEVYRYPSPLHAVALQSPLYAPQSPEHKRKSRKCSPGTFISNTTLLSSDFVHGQRGYECTGSCPHTLTTMQSIMSLTSAVAGVETSRCEEIVLKRARGETWNRTVAEGSGIMSWYRRSSASLNRTCSMGKSGTSSPFKLMPFQSRASVLSGSGTSVSLQASHPRFRGRLETHRNRFRRHTAALTNLNIFTEGKESLCARISAETSVHHHQRSSEAPQDRKEPQSAAEPTIQEAEN